MKSTTILLFVVFTCSCSAFRVSKRISGLAHAKREGTSVNAFVDSTLLSLGAGSIAGMVGTGTAYPFDALKTKAQAYASNRDGANLSLGMIDMAKVVLKEEGVRGFYGGVFGVMFGQSFIKAAAFGSNAWALSLLESLSGASSADSPALLNLILAASFSGFVSSFVINPIERVKILMQADSTGIYSSYIDCAAKVLAQDGITGLIFRGIDATMAREIPGNAVYFVVYALFVNSIFGDLVGPAAPFLGGAAAGIFSWIPVYPSDVIKTNMQNTQGSREGGSMGFLETAVYLQQKFGFGIFYDGIQPKLYRAGVSHSVTFYIYELLLRTFK